MNGARDFASLFILVLGYVLWSAALVALYAGHALSCETDASKLTVLRIPLATWFVGAIWLVHIVGTSVFALWIWRWRQVPAAEPPRTFVHTLTLALAASAFLATLWIGLPVLFVSPCV